MNHVATTKVGQFCLAFTLTLASGFVGLLQAQVPRDLNRSSINGPGEVKTPEAIQARRAWRQTMHAIPAPANGCFHASFPVSNWEEVECVDQAPYRSTPAMTKVGQTAGDGKDYVAQAPSGHFFSSVLGEFPASKDLKSEKDPDGANEYSLQLNTNFDFNSKACKGYSGCATWQQYLIVSNYIAFGATHLSGKTEVFIQDWLLNYGKHKAGKNICPSGWTDTGQAGSGDNCAKNSKAAVVANGQIPITQLTDLAVGGTAKKGGSDEVEAFYGDDAYKVSTPDSNTDISIDWSEAEFNIVGNGGGSKATFNTGAELLVGLLLDYGSETTPKCQPPSKVLGTTAETNNLTLGSCIADGGKTPYIEFEEGN